MTQDELISKQALQIAELEQQVADYKAGMRAIGMILHGIGGPLNDNKHGGFCLKCESKNVDRAWMNVGGEMQDSWVCNDCSLWGPWAALDHFTIESERR